MHHPSVILVPQGAEYQAVCRGLKSVKTMAPSVLPIPACPAPASRRVQMLVETGQLPRDRAVVLVGLCGSLTPTLTVGDVVLYQACLAGKATVSESIRLPTDSEFFDRCRRKMTLVNGYTSDRVVCLAVEKQQLAQQVAAQVVDMEGYSVLKLLNAAGIAATIIRVVSDDCQHNLPDLTGVYDADGLLKPGVMAGKMIQHPIASWHLIRGALRGLAVLQTTIAALFTP
ncbi:phosphorylase [Pantanalinema sp. GBBB05]|uniref:phosphorylase family protein n=1 Tax=Pantanalinema sp. GBBB05 TaxID=2604139 RepID=UPI001D63D347|nr:phosphorylase [Pantanalinema sp. GBBB05]